jgi:hypothetical protein
MKEKFWNNSSVNAVLKLKLASLVIVKSV